MLNPSRGALIALTALLGACASNPPPGPKPKPDLTPRLSALPTPGRASFDCSGALPEVHRQVCASDALAAQDRTLAELLHKRLDQLDLCHRYHQSDLFVLCFLYFQLGLFHR